MLKAKALVAEAEAEAEAEALRVKAENHSASASLVSGRAGIKPCFSDITKISYNIENSRVP
jgi:hypothetical protein